MRKPPLILIVEDNPASLDILQTRLTANDYKVITATDGEAGLTLARETQPDLILLDIMMPKMDGIEVCRHIKADIDLPFIPIIMVTAKVDSKDVVAGLEAGANEYLSKPVDHTALVARVRSMLRIKDLHDTVREQTTRLEEQSTQLAKWNQTLEHRVVEQLAEVERVGRLKRFLSPQLVEVITSSGGEELLESHRREVTVVFLDLRGFTAFSDYAEPEEVIGFLRSYHAEMGRLIFQFEGTLEHFAGDGIMVFFNDPIPRKDHTEKAVRMAMDIQARVRDLRNGWLKKGYDLDLGVGMASGYATLGTIGFEGRMDYAAVGNVTILASRLSSEAKGGQILTDQKTLSKIEDVVDVESIGDLQLKGFGWPTVAFNVLKLKD
ncbi:MAG: response regulator [Thermodesulfobacteriota bacterium]|nr:response regulator [Thermodesulfobacteriota bacterium]